MASHDVLVRDDARIRRVVDLDPFVLPIQTLFPTASLAQLRALAPILPKGHADFAGGTLLLAIQSHVIRLGGLTILIDTCVGEHKARPRRPDWDRREGTRYLANLQAAGCTPEAVDIVLCTHLHADHVGWNTRLEQGRWVPTFPNARYVISQTEIDLRRREAQDSEAANHGSFQDSVEPIIERGLLVPASTDSEIAPGARLIALPGHAPGQIGLELATGAPPVILCGDAIHSPVQVCHPDWSSAFCFDPAQAVRTRRALLQRAVEEDAVLLPAHLRAATLRVARDGAGYRPIVEGSA